MRSKSIWITHNTDVLLPRNTTKRAAQWPPCPIACAALLFDSLHDVCPLATYLYLRKNIFSWNDLGNSSRIRFRPLPSLYPDVKMILHAERPNVVKGDKLSSSCISAPHHSSVPPDLGMKPFSGALIFHLYVRFPRLILHVRHFFVRDFRYNGMASSFISTKQVILI